MFHVVINKDGLDSSLFMNHVYDYMIIEDFCADRRIS